MVDDVVAIKQGLTDKNGQGRRWACGHKNKGLQIKLVKAEDGVVVIKTKAYR